MCQRGTGAAGKRSTEWVGESSLVPGGHALAGQRSPVQRPQDPFVWPRAVTLPIRGPMAAQVVPDMDRALAAMVISPRSQQVFLYGTCLWIGKPGTQAFFGRADEPHIRPWEPLDFRAEGDESGPAPYLPLPCASLRRLRPPDGSYQVPLVSPSCQMSRPGDNRQCPRC